MIRVVVPVSGGKDSQSCLKLAVDTYGPDSVLGLFCDTQFEHPLTYQHVALLPLLYGCRVETITGGSVPEKVRRYKRFPGQARFCTTELKIRPSIQVYRFLADMWGHGFEVWYGVRSDESTQRRTRYAGKVCEELYTPHEFMPSQYPKYLAKMGVLVRLPVLDWSTVDVLDFLGGQQNPLYARGFDRVGCFPCLASGDEWKEKAFKHDAFGATQYATVAKLEREIGKSVWTSKAGIARNQGPGCALCAM